MPETMDELGPVDWLVVEFPGPDFGKGQIAPFLEDLVNRELIRVLDMVFLRKTMDGTLETAEISDLDPTELREVLTAGADLAMVLSEQDVFDLAETIEPGHSAAVLVWENQWAAPFGAAVRKAGGQLVASGRIPAQAVIAAYQADADAETQPEELNEGTLHATCSTTQTQDRRRRRRGRGRRPRNQPTP
jgi:hypothetical protein